MKFVFWVCVGVAAALAVALVLPSFSGGGRCKPMTPKNTCINTLRQIDGAKEQWALENKKSDGDPIIESELFPYIKGGKPKCPGGGLYDFGKVGETPKCTIAGHTIN